MSKKLSSVLALVIAAGTMSGAAASERPGDGKIKHLAVGAGRFEGQGPQGQTDVLMHVNASSRDGEAVGRFSVHRWLPTELQMNGEVTCLNVVGNRATIGGRVENLRKGSWPGSGILITVEDNGGEEVDRMHGDLLPTAPTDCPVPSETVRLPVQRGNFVVAAL